MQPFAVQLQTDSGVRAKGIFGRCDDDNVGRREGDVRKLCVSDRFDDVDLPAQICMLRIDEPQIVRAHTEN